MNFEPCPQTLMGKINQIVFKPWPRKEFLPHLACPPHLSGCLRRPWLCAGRLLTHFTGGKWAGIPGTLSWVWTLPARWNPSSRGPTLSRKPTLHFS